MRTITLFTRKSCHLCEVAREALARVDARLPFALVIVDLDEEASPEKRAAYDWDVPVLELDGRKVMKHRVDEERLLRLLTSAG